MLQPGAVESTNELYFKLLQRGYTVDYIGLWVLGLGVWGFRVLRFRG